ncbi:hypothetical protein R3W88_014845 [Solanum pinnatisectum]|uniref:Uncharacterized protein n=1 Tax=Solanum pinnatisectum TaxID=50273 RepID=A0AAV9KU14_9SOLN|nr:hypothetical protein R3W88_014845 [Solanum pinnatisectum]
MTALKANISKLADKSVAFPLLLVPDSLMNLLNMPPITQPIGDIWVDLERLEIGKRKEKKKTHDT